MAGTTTSLPGWTLPCALLVVLLAAFGNDGPIITVMGDAGKGGYWECPICERVEWKPAGENPRCAGIPGSQHDTADTKHPTGDNITTTDNDHYFF